MRLRYRRRRDGLVEALARHLPEAEIGGAAAGLHVTMALRPTPTSTRCWRGGRAWRRPPRHHHEGRPLLLVGYANIAEAALEPAVSALAAAVGASLNGVFLNILAAIDGSEHGAAALRTAAQLARDEHARLTVVTAVPPAPRFAALSAAGGAALTDAAHLMGEVGARIRDQVDTLPDDLSVTSIVVAGHRATSSSSVCAKAATTSS